MRKPLENIFMETALNFAERSTCLRKKVGAVLVRDKRIIATSYSGSPPKSVHCTDIGCMIGPNGGCIRTIHAEVNIIAFAAKCGIQVNGAVMYTTLSPCYDCAKLIVASGISTVYYYEEYRDTSPIEFLNILDVQTSKFEFEDDTDD